MKKRKFGRTDLQVSELCLSTASFGWLEDEATAFAQLDAYHAAGGSFFQAPGSRPHPDIRGASVQPAETWLGRWWQSRALEADKLIFAVRLAVSRPVRGGSIALVNHIRECCEASLRRLQVRHLDLLVCGWDERLAPVDDVVDALDMLIRAGIVRYAVAGGFPLWRVVDTLHRSGQRNRCRFEGLQQDYSLADRDRRGNEAFELCRELRLGFLAQSPLAGGYLARDAAGLPCPGRADNGWDERFGRASDDALLRALAQIAGRCDASPAQVALAWVLRNPSVSSALISAGSILDLEELTRSADVALDDDDTRLLTTAAAARDSRLTRLHA
jgi:aryl-alcohol dehydrogenase-like predicted oxidoreductase